MSMKDLFSTIVGAESQGADELSKSEEKAIVLTAEEAAEAVVEAQLATAEKEIAVHTASVEKHDAAIEVLEDKVESLEEALDGMEQMRSGGTAFNPELLTQYYNSAVKIGNSFGLKLERQGAESFGSKESAELVLFDGSEALKDIAVKALEEAKKFLVELWNSFISAVGNYNNAFKAVKDQADKLRGKITADNVTDGVVNYPADSFLINSTGNVGFGKSVKDALEHFKDSNPSEETYKSIVKALDQKNAFNHAEVVVGEESGTINATKAGNAPTEGKALDVKSLQSICDGVSKEAESLFKTSLDAKALQTQRDKSIASMGKDGKSEVFNEQKKYGRLSSKLIMSALALESRVLKAELAFVNAHLK